MLVINPMKTMPQRIDSVKASVSLLAFFVMAACCSSVAAAKSTLPAIDYKAYDDLVTPVLEQMTLAEKIGQMTQADLAGIKDRGDISKLALGSVLSGGNSDPADGNSVEAWTATYRECQEQAINSRLGLPILYGVDAVHGHNNVLGAVVFPHNIGLGCANDTALVEEIGRMTALEVRATGIPWNFAPCVAVARDDRWGRTYEAYSEDPQRVGPLGAALVRGMQGDDLTAPTSVMACVKHFVGDGGTTAEIGKSPFKEGLTFTLDQGDTRCDEETLRRLHVQPYLASLAAGAGTVMPSYSSWNGVKCTMNHDLLTKLLKEELGFEGFLISDYDAIDQCHEDYKTAIGLAINAGVDMAMVSTRYHEYMRLLTELVEEGEVPVARVDDAVRRILRVKAAMGMLDREAYLALPDPPQEVLGADAQRAVARRSVQQSLVLLKNNGVLPLEAGLKTIHVAGAKADDLGVQCGGWTIGWQGETGKITPGGTTVLGGISEVGEGVAVSFCADGTGAAEADLTIVVVGETPYAEGFGDDENLRLSQEDRELIARVSEADVPMVVVILSGRPLVLDEATIEGCDALVAAWLPGTEGAGVADILFGKATPSGTLSFSWPKHASQHPINVGDQSYSPRFPYGFGLTYPSQRPTRVAIPASHRSSH